MRRNHLSLFATAMLVILSAVFALKQLFIFEHSPFFFVLTFGYIVWILSATTGLSSHTTKSRQVLFFCFFVAFIATLLSMLITQLALPLLTASTALGILFSLPESKRKIQQPIHTKQEKEEPIHSEVLPSSNKFVSSKEASLFHLPTCAYVNRILHEKRCWFSSEQEAKQQGLTAHTCVRQ